MEVELEIDSKNDYEYLLFEDLKAAGFEPMRVRSGYNGNDAGRLHGTARRPGLLLRPGTGPRQAQRELSACGPRSPASSAPCRPRARRMYAPELKGNSDEIKIKIVD